MQNKITTYFSNPIVQNCVSVQAVEEQAGIPRKTLAHAIRGRRKLNEEHIAKLLPVLKALRFVLIAALLICTSCATSTMALEQREYVHILVVKKEFNLSKQETRLVKKAALKGEIDSYYNPGAGVRLFSSKEDYSKFKQESKQ